MINLLLMYLFKNLLRVLISTSSLLSCISITTIMDMDSNKSVGETVSSLGYYIYYNILSMNTLTLKLPYLFSKIL